MADDLKDEVWTTKMRELAPAYVRACREWARRSWPEKGDVFDLLDELFPAEEVEAWWDKASQWATYNPSWQNLSREELLAAYKENPDAAGNCCAD